MTAAATCHVCGKVYDGHPNRYVNEHNLSQHMKSKQAHKKKELEDSNNAVVRDVNNNAVECPICGKVYDGHSNQKVNEDNLRQHMESDKSHQFSVCPICYKVFNENDNQVDNEKRMRQHMNSKKNDRDHMPDPKIRDVACPICKDERFGASDSAVAHVESGACPGCKGKSRARKTVYNFVRTKGLEGMLAHPPRIKSSSSKNVTVPDFPYKCSICKKSFAEVCSLMQHQKHKHGNPGKKSLKALQK